MPSTLDRRREGHSVDARVSLRSSTMTETWHKTGPAWGESSDSVREPVETARKAAIEAPCHPN